MAPRTLTLKHEAKFVFEKGCEQLIIGSGQVGNVHLSPEAEAYFAKKGCKVLLQPTHKAIHLFNGSKVKKGRAFSRHLLKVAQIVTDIGVNRRPTLTPVAPHRKPQSNKWFFGNKWGHDWTPIQSWKNERFPRRPNYLNSIWGGVKVGRRFTDR